MKERDYGFLLLGLTSLGLFITFMLARGFLVPHAILTEWAQYMTSTLQITLTCGILIYSLYLINKK